MSNSTLLDMFLPLGPPIRSDVHLTLVKVCSMDGCGRRATSWGFCDTHYYRLRHGVPMDTPVRTRSYDGITCSVDGCDRRARAGGLCQRCWRKSRYIPRAKRKISYTLEELQSYANGRGGILVSEALGRNTKTKLQWRCAVGHEWMAVPRMVLGGTWCRVCSRLRRRLTMDEANQIATAHGGRCLSETYVGGKSLLEWECEVGHRWLRSLSGTKKGSWCVTCSSRKYKGESITRAIMERMFHVPFLKVRPPWLQGKNGHALELDGYNDDLKIAFEFQGEQHYVQGEGTFSKIDLADLQERDQLKRDACRLANVSLVIVRRFKKGTDVPGCVNQVDLAVRAAGISPLNGWLPPDRLPELDCSLDAVFGILGLEQIRQFVANKGGRLISDRVGNGSTGSKLTWECGKGHQWQATWARVRQRWCRVCRRGKC